MMTFDLELTHSPAAASVQWWGCWFVVLRVVAVAAATSTEPPVFRLPPSPLPPPPPPALPPNISHSAPRYIWSPDRPDRAGLGRRRFGTDTRRSCERLCAIADRRRTDDSVAGECGCIELAARRASPTASRPLALVLYAVQPISQPPTASAVSLLLAVLLISVSFIRQSRQLMGARSIVTISSWPNGTRHRVFYVRTHGFTAQSRLGSDSQTVYECQTVRSQPVYVGRTDGRAGAGTERFSRSKSLRLWDWLTVETNNSASDRCAPAGRGRWVRQGVVVVLRRPTFQFIRRDGRERSRAVPLQYEWWAERHDLDPLTVRHSIRLLSVHSTSCHSYASAP